MLFTSGTSQLGPIPVADDSPSWVRDFGIEYVPQMREPSETQDQPARSLLILAEEQDLFVESLRCRMELQGVSMRVARFPHEVGESTPPLPPGQDLIAVLPRTPSQGIELRARLLRMVQRLRAIATPPRGSRSRTTRVVFVQFGGGRFGTGSQPADPEVCCATSFARSLHLERPDLVVRVVDLSPVLAPEEAAEAVVAELSGNGSFVAAGYDADAIRRVPRVCLLQPVRFPRRGLRWSSEDVILITGGGKGITAECALALARVTGARMALVGSSPLPAPQSGGQLIRTLERFHEERLPCRYFPCDLTDARAVAILVQAVHGELGPITGVIHGAGVSNPRRLEQVSAAAALAEIEPKLLGASHLCRALHDAPPRLFLALTSITGVTGMPGNAWNAFSNEALDLVIRRFGADHPETAVLSIAFGSWGSMGTGPQRSIVKTLGQVGMSAIPTIEGVRRFLKLFTFEPGDQQVVVTSRLGRLDTWPIEAPAVADGLRFVENIVRCQPGVELVTRTRLNLERDGWLRDYVFRGSCVVPIVFALEAMAQAAACVTGEREPGVVRLEDIRVERPIVVDPQSGVLIEVGVEVLERTVADELRVRVGIRSETTGFAADHISAVLVLGRLAKGPKVFAPPTGEPLNIRPQTDLYGSLLFQGPRFRKIGAIFELDGHHTVFASEVDDVNARQNKTCTPNQEGRLLLGDPFFRDVLFQAGQLMSPQEVCLPVRIKRIERYQPAASAQGRRIVVVPFKLRRGREYVAEVFTVDEEGNLVERLIGCWLRILEERPENPTVKELAYPPSRGKRLWRGSQRLGAVIAPSAPGAETPLARTAEADLARTGLLGESFQDLAGLRVLQHRNNRQLHQVAPHQREFHQGLGVITLEKVESAAEIGTGPAAQQLRSPGRLSSCPGESGDGLIPPLGFRFDGKSHHELHLGAPVR